MENLHVVLLAGGKGERLWPLSRSDRPKQFLPLLDGKPLIQTTRERFPFVPTERILVVAPEEQAPLFARHTPDLEVLAEPEGKNTFPALVFASLVVNRRSPGAPLFVAPADHVVRDLETFRMTLEALYPFVMDGKIGTIGIRPDRPETGYGYIQPGKPVRSDPPRVFALARFHEKPDRETAERYVREGFLWNSGMFFFRSDAFLEEVGRLYPETVAFIRDFARERVRELYGVLPATSVDYAVMEKTTRGVVAEGSFDWEDVGSFLSLWRILPKDARGNVVVGRAVVEDCENALIWAEDGVVAARGLRGQALIQSGGVSVTLPLQEAQEVKALRRSVLARFSDVVSG